MCTTPLKEAGVDGITVYGRSCGNIVQGRKIYATEHMVEW
jgi:hypothetical protein